MYEQVTSGGLLESPDLEVSGGEATDVYCWRMEQLLRFGYSHVAADIIAARTDIDLHVACDLLARGCSERLACKIVL